MRTLDADFITEKNLQVNDPIFLYTIYDYDDASTNLYFNSWNTTITFDGVDYLPEVIVHETIRQSQDGSVETVDLMIGNVNRVIQAYLEVYDWRGKKVSIKRVFLDKIADTSAFYNDNYFIEDYTAKENEVEFTLTSKFNLLNVQIPGRIMSRNFCPWVFKGTECAYTGSETSCVKTLARCRELENQLRYGGFPSIPSRRVISG